MSKSAFGQVIKYLAITCHQLQEQSINTICTAMVVLVYGAKKGTTTRCRKIHLHMNTAQKETTK
jgi:hypothetical protein